MEFPQLRTSWKAAKSESHDLFLYLACVSLFFLFVFLELTLLLFYIAGTFDILQGIIFLLSIFLTQPLLLQHH